MCFGKQSAASRVGARLGCSAQVCNCVHMWDVRYHCSTELKMYVPAESCVVCTFLLFVNSQLTLDPFFCCQNNIFTLLCFTCTAVESCPQDGTATEIS